MLAIWPAVIDLVGEQNAMVGAALQGGKPVEVNARELVVAFPPQAEFSKRKAEQDEHRRATMEALRSLSGHPLALRYELREPAEEPDGPADPSLSGEELVQRFVEEFNAEELIDEEDGDRSHAG